MVYALYFEFQDGNRIHQFVLIPSAAVTPWAHVQPTLAARNVRDGKASSWAVRSTGSYQRTASHEKDPNVIIREELNQLSGLAPILVGALADPSQVLRTPLVIGLTEEMLKELHISSTKLPAALKAEITNARAKAGFEAIPGASI